MDKGTGFVCSQSSCGHCISSSEVSHRLQEIRVNLEKAVDLMERERPGEKQYHISNALQYVDTLMYHCGLSRHVIVLLHLPSDEALRLLNRAQSQPGLILAETHPLQGELADAMARACATMGEKNKFLCGSYNLTLTDRVGGYVF